jgi:arylsulfatase A-like enzyme
LESLLAVDDAVGRIINALWETGRLHNTGIILASDNGDLWGEHRFLGKNVPYDESTRIPLVMRYDAGGGDAGAIVQQPAANVDIGLTFARLAGIAPNSVTYDHYETVEFPAARQFIGGASLTQLAAYEDVYPDRLRIRRRFVVLEGKDRGRRPAYCGIRLGDVGSGAFAYVHYSGGYEELYEAGDPYQLRNVVHDAAGRERVREELRSLRQAAKDWCFPSEGFDWRGPEPATVATGPPVESGVEGVRLKTARSVRVRVAYSCP